MSHFPKLKAQLESVPKENLTAYTDFLASLKDQFELRFCQFSNMNELLCFVERPKMWARTRDTRWKEQAREYFSRYADIPNIELELCDLTTDSLVENADPVEFYSTPANQEKYPKLVQLGKAVLCVFGSTYLCESMFSKMNHIKNKHRSTLTDDHLTQLMTLANEELSSIDFADVMSKKSVFHTSH